MQATEDILGYTVARNGVQHCVDEIMKGVATGNDCRWLACLNPHSYVVSLDDQLYAASLHDADWLVPDGAGIILASRVQQGRVRERVTGSDIFAGVHARINKTGGSVFFLGSTEETLEKIRSRMANDYPNIKVVGTYSPPFKPAFTDEENAEMVAAINKAAPDVLWVGMTAPKQEKWIHQNKFNLQVKFAGAIGAVFDFYTGRVKRSHPVFQYLGLEWLPRLIQEPRRLWRRNFISNPKFILKVIQYRLKNGNLIKKRRSDSCRKSH